MKKPTHITVKRWFQKTYGNTYFSATVSFDDGSEQQVIEYEYGYGMHGLDRAVRELVGAGFLGSKDYDAVKLGYHALLDANKVTYDVVNVQRKKDL